MQASSPCKAESVGPDADARSQAPTDAHTHLSEGLEDKACDLLLSSCAADLLPAGCRSGAHRRGPARKHHKMSEGSDFWLCRGPYHQGFKARMKAADVKLGRFWTKACVCDKCKARKIPLVTKVTSIRPSNMGTTRDGGKHARTDREGNSLAARQ